MEESSCAVVFAVSSDPWVGAVVFCAAVAFVVWRRVSTESIS